MDGTINLLGWVSIVTGVVAGVAFLVLAGRQPEKARQLRGLGILFLGLAVVMAIVTLL